MAIRVYLSGPMAECDEYQMREWREEMKKALGPEFVLLDPTDRGRFGDKLPIETKERQLDLFTSTQVVEFDKADIDACDIMVAYVWKPSHGTSMEILYAWERNKFVLSVAPNIRSPWVTYHSHEVVSCIDEAIVSLKKWEQRKTLVL